jgi:RHS repeat-associated protein
LSSCIASGNYRLNDADICPSMTDTGGNQINTTMKYLPFGVCRNSPENFPTDKLFTGQRLDGTGLYYYGARYYDAGMGRFISADIIIPHPTNPQSFNRYSYCLNNPLKYVDPSGHVADINGLNSDVVANALLSGNYMWLTSAAVQQAAASPLLAGWIGLAGKSPNLTNMMINSSSLFEILRIDFGSNESGLPVVNANVHTDYWGNPSYMVTYVPDDVWSPASALGVGGVSIGPFGVWVRYQERASQWIEEYTFHEIDHRVWQGRMGYVPWYCSYGSDLLSHWAYYGGDFWEGAHDTSFWEHSAFRMARQPIPPNPTPWWKPGWDSFSNYVSGLATDIADFLQGLWP